MSGHLYTCFNGKNSAHVIKDPKTTKNNANAQPQFLDRANDEDNFLMSTGMQFALQEGIRKKSVTLISKNIRV